MSRFSQFAGSGSGGGVVTGQVNEFINGSNPTGYLQLNGQCVCKSTYSCLYGVLGDQDPPASETLNIIVNTPAGWNCTCFFATFANGSCIIRAGAFHCILCCGKLATMVCFATSSGCCGCMNDTSGGAFNSYYSTMIYAPCQAYDISIGYDCNTCKVYLAVPYTINNGYGTCMCHNYLKVFNITDNAVVGGAYIASSLSYNQSLVTHRSSCLINMCSITTGQCLCLVFGKICYPAISVHCICCVACPVVFHTQSNCTCCNIYNNMLCTVNFALYTGTQGRNPTYFIFRGASCMCVGYGCFCYSDSIGVIDTSNGACAVTNLGCSNSVFSQLTCCGSSPAAGTGASCAGSGANFFGFYCDASYIGLTGTHLAGYCYNSGGYGAPTINFYDPSKYRFTRTLFNKTCPTCQQVVFCCPAISSVISGTLSSVCEGPATVIYIPKCCAYHVNKVTINCFPACCSCCPSPAYSGGFFGSSPLNCSVTTYNVNCIGINSSVCDSSQTYRSSNVLPHCCSGITFIQFGFNTLGPSSNLFLVPSVTHVSSGLRYFIKT